MSGQLHNNGHSTVTVPTDSSLLDSCLLDSCLLASCLLDSCLLRVAGLWSQVVGSRVSGSQVSGSLVSVGAVAVEVPQVFRAGQVTAMTVFAISKRRGYQSLLLLIAKTVMAVTCPATLFLKSGLRLAVEKGETMVFFRFFCNNEKLLKCSKYWVLVESGFRQFPGNFLGFLARSGTFPEGSETLPAHPRDTRKRSWRPRGRAAWDPPVSCGCPGSQAPALPGQLNQASRPRPYNGLINVWGRRRYNFR